MNILNLTTLKLPKTGYSATCENPQARCCAIEPVTNLAAYVPTEKGHFMLQNFLCIWRSRWINDIQSYRSFEDQLIRAEIFQVALNPNSVKSATYEKSHVLPKKAEVADTAEHRSIKVCNPCLFMRLYKSNFYLSRFIMTYYTISQFHIPRISHGKEIYFNLWRVYFCIIFGDQLIFTPKKSLKIKAPHHTHYTMSQNVSSKNQKQQPDGAFPMLLSSFPHHSWLILEKGRMVLNFFTKVGRFSLKFYSFMNSRNYYYWNTRYSRRKACFLFSESLSSLKKGSKSYQIRKILATWSQMCMRSHSGLTVFL